ncbi:FabD/lysophospholipase-like protein [Stipitochalara longipes BDJ]|nr:FabD/lysophospholipase-like protein [Stipitochalara longipes BDJ]
MAEFDEQLKLLSLDGGGVRGLSVLIILEHLVDRSNRKRKEQGLEPQEPWQMFHLIGGTSTGGIIAVMLGRLRMSIADCRKAYEEISQQAFTPLHSKANFVVSAFSFWNVGSTFDEKELEKAIKEVIGTSLKHGDSDPNRALLQENEEIHDIKRPCKVLVACTHEDVTREAIFRTYLHPTKVRTKVFENCLIWQACRATSAAPSFFPPIEIGGQKFLDGGVLFNNPVQLVYREAQDLWPDKQPLLISIGTGDAPMEGFGKNLVEIVKSLRNIATETEETANNFLEGQGRRMAKDGRYYRFNVPTLGMIGLEEWKAAPKIVTLTEIYLDKGDMAEKTAACVQKLSRVISHVEATEERQKLKWLTARQNSFPLGPQIHHIPVEKFIASGEGILDTDYPGRYFYYRETVHGGGYPAGVQMDPQFINRDVRPISNTIITCRRTVNLQIRGKERWIAPGSYRVTWIFWFVAGRKCPSSSQQVPRNFVPELPQENSIYERFFPSTVETESPPKLDSGYVYPWDLICSVGRPKQYKQFLIKEFDLDENPLAARVLLQEGFQEMRIDPGYWNTLRNTGWVEVTGPIVEVADDGQLAFVVSKKWKRFWVGGFSFGGVRLEPI